MIARLVRSKLFWLFVATVASLATLSITSKTKENSMFYEKALSYVYVPVQKGLTYVGYNIQNSMAYFADAKLLSQENKELKFAIDKLEEENRKLMGLEQENKRLGNLLGIKDKFQNYEMITCRIIAKDSGNWFNTFTIDKGINDGISPNMTVITPNGIVGQTVSATPSSAKVMTIIDNGGAASARLSKSRELVVVSGDITLKEELPKDLQKSLSNESTVKHLNPPFIRMKYIPVGVQVSVGDEVETSGVGGIFPPGIMIGKVVEVDNDKPQLMRYAIIQPTVDFKRLEEVVVLKNK